MPHLPPLSRDAVPQFKERFEHYKNTRRFIPNSILTMSRRPAIAAVWEFENNELFSAAECTALRLAPSH